MKVFLTGANGVMGRSTVTAMHEAGHDVVGLVRNESNAREMAALGVEPVIGDLYDLDRLTTAMSGADAVANLATKVPRGSGALRPGSLKAIDRIRLHGSRVVAQAAVRAGVGRIVQQSLSFIYIDAADDWLDEYSPVDVTRATEPVVVAEENVLAVADQGVVGVCLRFGLITGPDANSAWLLQRARAGKSIGMGREGSWMHVIHPDDVGTAVVHALVAPGGVYNVGVEPVQRRDYVDTFAQAAGRREGRFMPNWVLRVGAEKLEILTRSQRVSSQRFSDVTGWHPSHPKLTPDWLDDVA